MTLKEILEQELNREWTEEEKQRAKELIDNYKYILIQSKIVSIVFLLIIYSCFRNSRFHFNIEKVDI